MKRFIPAVSAVFLFCAFSVFGGGAGDSPAEEEVVEVAESSESSLPDSITIVDDRGVEVTIDLPVQRVATFPLPHPHIIAAVDGNLDRVVGASSMSVSAAKISVLGKMYSDFLNVDTSYLDGLSLNLEELARINPDVFFTDKVLDGMDQLEATGIPTVYMGLKKETVPYAGGEVEAFSPKATMKDWVGYTAAVLGKNESNALDIADLWGETEKEIAEIVSKVPVEERPKVLIMFKTKALMVAGDATFGHCWIARTGGINAAEEAKGNHPAFVKIGSFEDILNWNPDVIYLSNFEDTMPSDIYGNTIDGQDWSQISAVVNNRVHRIPLGIYRWYPPSLDGPLMLKWMAQKNYPELFDFDMKEEVREYFKEYHHYDLSDSELEGILDPASSGTL